MEVLPGPTTAQGVARTKQPEKVETHGGAESTEGTEAHVKQSEKVETHGGAEGTGGTEAHVKQPEKVETHGGAEGTGGTEAHVTEAQTHEAPNTDVAKLVPKSAYLTILKASVNFHQDGHKRKFLIKDFGSLETSLSVAEVFAKKISQCRFEFDQVSKKPDLRKDFLMKFGWPEGKSCKRDLKKQQTFMMDALCNQEFQQLEADLLITCIRCIMGEQCKNCYLTHRSDGFHARVKPKDDVTLEKRFDTLGQARKWIEQVMAVEDREGLTKIF